MNITINAFVQFTSAFWNRSVSSFIQLQIADSEGEVRLSKTDLHGNRCEVIDWLIYAVSQIIDLIIGRIKNV